MSISTYVLSWFCGMTASMNRDLIELYSDYLLFSFSKITVTGLSELLENQYSHDRITRLLSSNNFSSTTLWRQVKPVVRKDEASDGVLIVDDTMGEMIWCTTSGYLTIAPIS